MKNNFFSDIPNIERKFSEFLNHNLESTANSILIGLSGGADSSVLLRLMKEYCDRECISLFALHVNHMIRSDEAERDEAFCKRLCDSLEVTFFSEKVNIPLIAAETKKGLEEAARDERYRLLYIYADRYKCDYIALAHNSTDNLETVIFNLARGSGTTGACGIPPVRDIIIRPLIAVSKEEILSYAEYMGYEYVTDSTNEDTVYTRNMIRAGIIPLLKAINPDVEGAITRMTQILREDDAYLSEIAERYRSEQRCDVLLSLKMPVLKRVLRSASGTELSYTNILQITDLLKKYDVNSAYSGYICLKGSVYACVKNGLLTFSNTPPKNERSDCQYDIPVSPGETPLPCGGSIFVSFTEESLETSLYNEKKCAEFYISEKNLSNLRVRTRLPGDTISIRGMTRKVKKILNEMKIDEFCRDTYPLLTLNNEIIWIPSYGISDNLTNNNMSEMRKIRIFYIVERKD